MSISDQEVHLGPRFPAQKRAVRGMSAIMDKGGEGLYIVRFAQTYVGAGVVVLETQRLFGGDSRYYWVGDYTVNGDQVTASAKVVMHTRVPELGTIFGDGAERFEIELTGAIREDHIEALMTRRDMPGVVAPVVLEYREPLP